MTISPPESPAALLGLWPNSESTPLLDLPRLAQRCGVARVLVKDEGKRPLGSFKALGGMYAGLRALVRSGGYSSMATLVASKQNRGPLTRLLCASDGNHGLAVAAAAELAGAPARVYLPRGVSQTRVRRIADRGAELVLIEGTYDDAVDEAWRASQRGEGLLIADTSKDEADPVVAEVMAGYGLLAHEIVEQLRAMKDERPTHLFVQAGVGGLAAAMAEGVRSQMGGGRQIVVVEPEKAACVAAALKLRKPVPIEGDLHTVAEMLSCGEACAAALKVLLKHQALAITVSETSLIEAVADLISAGGPTTTPSGACGLAGLLASTPGTPLAQKIAINERSRILLIATEGPLPG